MEIRKKIIVLAMVMISSLYAIPQSVNAQELTNHFIDGKKISAYANTIPRVNDIGWIYQTMDGKIYKRLYDYTTQKWLGDWILC